MELVCPRDWKSCGRTDTYFLPPEFREDGEFFFGDLIAASRFLLLFDFVSRQW